MNHVQAKTIVDSLPGMSPHLSLLTRGVAWLESNYGQGWKGDGVGSHNMGAITGTYQGQYFTYGDSRNEAGEVVKYTTKFRKYPDDRAGFQDLATLLSKRYSGAVDAAKDSDWPGASRALYGYYLGVKPTKEANIAVHAKALTNAVSAITAATGESLPSTLWGGPNGPGVGPGTIFGALGALSLWWWLLRRRKTRK